MTMTLTEAEAALLRDVLVAALADLRMEIRSTDARQLREQLHVREELLRGLIAKAGEPVEGAGR
jgi:hypothetical protein